MAQQLEQSSEIGADEFSNSIDKTTHSALKFNPVRTDSPRRTLDSFVRLTLLLENDLQAYKSEQNRANYERVQLLIPRFLQLLDLRAVPTANHRDVGLETTVYLLDILGRIKLPPMESVPDDTLFEDDKPARWRIPGTPLRITRVDDGPREGEFLISGRTVGVAPWFYQHIEHQPLRSTIDIKSWSKALPHLYGPLVPAALVSALPERFRGIWLDTPIWKILFVIILFSIAVSLLYFWHRVVYRSPEQHDVGATFFKLLSPLAIIATFVGMRLFITNEIQVTGEFAQLISFIITLINYLVGIWAFWLSLMVISEAIILSPRIPDESLDANLLRLLANVIGVIGSVLILAYGAQSLGLPVMGLLAGLGVGGLAVALAIRPTLENLIGGAILYADRPVRIGDFCSFGAFTGTVESIGVRSTQIRTLDRTLVTIPNANFSNMEISNWARCDKMMIRTTIGVRYETGTDQLRYLLANLRDMCYAHPKVDPETVRIRFIGYGASSMDIDFRIYATTRDWSEFYAIREDIYLRVNDIVDESGTSFAFPSQTLYMGQDDGLDDKKSSSAEEAVASWRQSGNLPFPNPGPEKLTQLESTLDFPPRGSPESQIQIDAEPLSDIENDDEENSGVKVFT
ncbi:MAG: mechanosensitive ion channel family protein [Desulfobacterales bacterium]|nr:mechanosensitive ion channel family protein [Desulfobacterales bacterium]